MNWREKDDLDLTSEDISAMAAEGEPVTVHGPHLPGNGALVSAATTQSPATVLHPELAPPPRLSWWRRTLLRAARIGTRRDLATLNRVEREFLNPPRP